MFWHSATLHFSKLSSFRHFECSLHVWSICELCEKRDDNSSVEDNQNTIILEDKDFLQHFRA